ncbi:MAG TPA: hypothetical protein VFF65_13880, partial [Phycisphaerales bacterium]|nr:hypothetical protein [Phycisphaerales bacterium]
DLVNAAPPLPHADYSTLFLTDYLTQKAPDAVGICTEDRQQLQWSQHAAETIAQFPADPYRWARSSYSVPLAFFASIDQESAAATLRLTDIRDFQIAPQTPLGVRRITEVAFPSQRVMHYERFARHGRGQPLFFTHPQAQVQVLVADGSTRLLKTADTNPGGYVQPNNSVVQHPVAYTADPAFGDPLWPTGVTPLQPPRYAATVGGLKGIDFGGPEIGPAAANP